MAVRALLAAVESAGVERERFLVAAGLDEALLADVTARMPIAEYRRVVTAVLETTGDPAFGLHMGERASMSAFDVLGHLAEHSSDLREALLTSVRYGRIAADGVRLELEEEADVATLRLKHVSGDAPDARLTAEFVTSALMMLVGLFVGPGALPRRALFAYEPPPHRAEYTRIFGGRERFSHPFTGLELERAWLEEKRLARSPELHALLKERAELLLAKVDRAAAITDRVKRWLAAQSLQTKPTMEACARALGMSARSLRRHLLAESASFDALVGGAQAIRAKQMLEDPRCSIQEAAFALGFSTPAAFTRAFKRWTGVTPTDFRKDKRV